MLGIKYTGTPPEKTSDMDERETRWMAVNGFKTNVNLTDQMSNRSTRVARLRYYQDTLEMGRNVNVPLEGPNLGCHQSFETFCQHT